MPSLRDLRRRAAPYLLPVGLQIAGGVTNRRTATGATRTLMQGADTALQTIAGGADRARTAITDVYGQQRETLAPYRRAGERSLADLEAGVAAGGGLADPFTRGTEFSRDPEFRRPTDFSFTAADLMRDPSFQFRLEQGRRAIEAGANAGGIRFSGATLKALSDYNQESASQEFGRAYERERGTFGENYGRAASQFGENYDRAGGQFRENYGRAEDQFRRNQQDRYNRLMGVQDIGQQAAGQEVTAGSAYGANLANLEQSTAQQISNLELERANAQAAGDVERANAITDTIAGILDTVNKIGTAKSLADLARRNVAPPPTAPDLPSPALATLPPSISRTVPSLAAAAPAIPAPTAIPPSLTVSGLRALPAVLPKAALAAPAAPALSSAGAAGAATATPAAASSAGTSAAIAGFLSNPVTIAVAAAIIGVMSAVKSQARHEASTWVRGFQNPFDRTMDQLNRQFNAAAEAGQLSREQAQQIRSAAAEAIERYTVKLASFERQGSDERQVAKQARRTIQRYYGPGFVDFLGGMDQIIAGLPNAS